MELPQEIELWYVIPAIRKALVVELKQKGFKQKDVAGLLGITESAVSQYIKDKRASCCYAAFDNEPLKGEIKKSADRLVVGGADNFYVQEINRLCKIIREKKIICDIHRKQKPDIKKCNLCYD